MFIRADAAFEPIVDRAIFIAAQSVFADRELHTRRSDDEMLECLRRLGAQKGYLSKVLVRESKGVPSASSFQQRFGSLTRAFFLAGYASEKDSSYIQINRELRVVRAQVIAAAIAGVGQVGGTVKRDLRTEALIINGEFSVSFIVTRCKETQRGSLRWRAALDPGADISILIRMDRSNRAILDYYILPRNGLTPCRLRLGERNGVALDSFRTDSLETFFILSARSDMQEVAHALP